MTRWVSVTVAAGICRVNARTVRRWCEDGKIPPAHQQITPGGHYRIDADHAHRLFIVDSGEVECPHCGRNFLQAEESRTSRTPDSGEG